MMTLNELPAAVRQLDDAVFELTKTRTMRTTTGVFTAPSLWVQMQQEVHGTSNGRSSNTTGESRLPLWSDGVDWCRTIDRTVREWLPHQQGHTLTLLLALPEHRWAPDQMDTVHDIATTVHRWVREAQRFLSGESEMDYRDACPHCDTRQVWRHIDGENIKVPAITITTTLVRCKHCSTEWEPWQFARLIGVDQQLILDTIRTSA